MISSRRTLSRFAYVFFELVLTTGAFLAAEWMRGALRTELHKVFTFGQHLWLLPVVLVVWMPLLWYWGFQRAHRTADALQEAWKILKVVSVGSLIVGAVIVIRKFDPSRVLLGLFVGFDAAGLVVFRMLAISIAHHSRKRGYDRIYVLVAGTGKAARKHVAELQAHPEWGLEVKGMLSEGPKLAIDEVGGVKVLGSIGDLPSLLRKEVVDEVHFAVSRRTLEKLDEAVRACDEIGATVRIVMGLFGQLNSRPTLELLTGTPLLTLSSAPRDEVALLLKRILDMAISIVALLASSPVLLVSSLLIKLTSPGPIIFRQRRSGMNGRTFTLYKFRTMVRDAEAKRDQLVSKNEMDGPVFKIKNDPRVTRVGRVFRKLSIDELPQLWNVLRGDMSIVGPRPPIPAEVEKYEQWQRRRLSMRPGITCIWQISGRNDVDFRRWMEMDLEYIDNWSLALDLKIILKTIPAVLISRGAS
jgi:exopolysaccharide biosynthesis polyprenyl glycosylphosphotransferase